MKRIINIYTVLGIDMHSVWCIHRSVTDSYLFGHHNELRHREQCYFLLSTKLVGMAHMCSVLAGYYKEISLGKKKHFVVCDGIRILR